MSDGGYKIRNQAAIHFITFAVVEWVDVFIRKEYRDIVLESIKHCQSEKGIIAACMVYYEQPSSPGYIGEKL